MFAATAAAARAEAAGPAVSFEQLLRDAQPINDRAQLAELIDPAFASCDGADPKGDSLSRSRCQAVLRWLLDRRATETYASLGDEAALSFAPYDPLGKTMETTVVGCLACGKPIKQGDKLRFVTTRVPKAIKQSKAFGLDVESHEIAIPDAAAARIFDQKVRPRLRVQFLWKLGSTWKSGFEGVSFAPVAHRVFDRCTGEVYASVPASKDKVLQFRDASCPAPGEDLTDEERQAQAERLALPVQLSRQQIEATMAPVQAKASECHTEFEVTGTASIQLVILPEGKLESVTILPPFDKTPVGYCLKTALSGVRFQEFRGKKMKVNFPLHLR